MMQVDVVVAGGGMAGLTAALTAQEQGAQVVLLEKAPRLGGSAAVSGGTVWCAADLESWLSVHPGGDPALGRALIGGFDDGIRWLKSHRVELVEQPDPAPYRFRRVVYAMKPDAAAALGMLAECLATSGGALMVDTALQDVLVADGRVRGVRALCPTGPIEIFARGVILATGGFQGNGDLRVRYMGRWADRMVLRANPHSTGDGLAAAVRAGVATAGPFDRFYGHMLPAPPARVGLHNFAQVKPDFSERAIFVNLRGERFDDEALGDEVTAQAAVRQPEATVFLICDEAIRRAALSAGPTPRGTDRIQSMRDAGAEILEAESLDILADSMSMRWAVHRDGLLRTLRAYNRAAWLGQRAALSPPKSAGLMPLERPPYYAVRCLPGITFTYGGVLIDPAARALDSRGHPITGLFAAGADAGGIYTRGYTGGLSLGLVFGRIAGRESTTGSPV